MPVSLKEICRRDDRKRWVLVADHIGQWNVFPLHKNFFHMSQETKIYLDDHGFMKETETWGWPSVIFPKSVRGGGNNGPYYCELISVVKVIDSMKEADEICFQMECLGSDLDIARERFRIILKMVSD
jgi:hypothetical protein